MASSITSNATRFPPPLTHRRKSYFGHIHLAVVGCVSVAGLQDIAADVSSASVDSQIPPIYLLNELHLHIGHRGHH